MRPSPMLCDNRRGPPPPLRRLAAARGRGGLSTATVAGLPTATVDWNRTCGESGPSAGDGDQPMASSGTRACGVFVDTGGPPGSRGGLGDAQGSFTEGSGLPGSGKPLRTPGQKFYVFLT